MRKMFAPATSSLLLLFLFPFLGVAQTSIPGTNPVTENFNGIGATAAASLPGNWKMSSAATGLTSNWTTGTNVTATTVAASTGSPSTGGRYNWGISTNVTDRAIGFITSGNYNSPNSIMAFYRNTSGTSIISLTINFNVKRFKVNTATCSIAFFTSTDGANWMPQPAGDISLTEFTPGTSSGTFATPTTASRIININNLSIANNGDIYLRWVFTNTGNTNSQGLGLDDVSLTAGVASTTYYPKTSATDLSQTIDWTTDPAGGAGTSPTNFTSPNQLFNLNDNVANPTINGPWEIAGGSNVILNNINSLVFTSAASLKVGAGSAIDFNSKTVTLKSNASGTAFIGTLTGTLSNADNVTVERYITSLNNRAYRLLAPSVNTTTTIHTNWQENASNAAGLGTHITGSTTGANGFDATQTGQASMFTYDAVTPAWVPIANTNTNTLNAKTGYLTFIRGDRTIDLSSTSLPLPGNNTTLRSTGTLLTGPQSFTGLTGNSGFNLITNPYAAPINWASVHAASVGATQFYTLWDPNIGLRGAFVTVSTSGFKSNASSNATTIIQSGQAFFVQASGAPGPIVNIEEGHKSSANNIDVFRLGAQTELFTSSLFYIDQFSNSINADGVTSVYHNSYDTIIDGNDAAQIANWDEDVAIARRNNALTIESRPLINVSDTIPFTIARLKIQNYEWQFNSSNFNHPNLQASLVDKFLNTRTPVSLNGSTVVAFTVTSDGASTAADRFMIVFGPNNALPVNLSTVKAYQKAKDIQVEWTAQTEVNMEKYEVEKSTNGQQFSKATSVVARGNNNNPAAYDWMDVNANNGNNYYRIKAISKTGEVHYSKVIRVNIGNVGNRIGIYPNPINDYVVSLSLNLPKGKYTITLTNKLGQQIFNKEIEHLGGAATQTVQFENNLAQGVYQLAVSDGENNYVQQLIKK
jgi:hypothetical protein